MPSLETSLDDPKSAVQMARKYLGVLQEALKKQQDVVANYRFVDFSPKK